MVENCLTCGKKVGHIERERGYCLHGHVLDRKKFVAYYLRMGWKIPPDWLADPEIKQIVTNYECDPISRLRP